MTLVNDDDDDNTVQLLVINCYSIFCKLRLIPSSHPINSIQLKVLAYTMIIIKMFCDGMKSNINININYYK